MSMQLPLGIGLHDSASFSTFHAGENRPVLVQIELAATGAGEPVLFIHGAAGVGKSHLLQAACAAATQAGHRAALLPLSQAAQLAPEAIEGWDAFDLVCVDDIAAIAGDADWESALFGLFNALRNAGGRWIATGTDVPAALGLKLPDLSSRLASGPVFGLQPLDDTGRIAALQLRAGQRGLELPTEVGEFMLKHLPRDMGSLYKALEALDRASMAAQRKVTIPFVKTTLGL